MTGVEGHEVTLSQVKVGSSNGFENLNKELPFMHG